MMPAHRHILIGTLVSISLVALFTIEGRPIVRAAEGDEVEYTFDRPMRDRGGEADGGQLIIKD